MVDLQQMTRRTFRFSGSMARHGLRQESSMEAASLQKSKTASLLAQSNRRLARINDHFNSERRTIEVLVQQLEERQMHMKRTLYEIRSARRIQAAFRTWMEKKMEHKRRCRLLIATWCFYAFVRRHRRAAAGRIIRFYRAMRVIRVKAMFTIIIKAIFKIRKLLRNRLLLKKARKDALILAFANRNVEFVVNESTKTIMCALKETWSSILKARRLIGSKLFPYVVRHRRLAMLESERGLALFAILSDKRTPAGQRKYRTGNLLFDDILRVAQEAFELIESQKLVASGGGVNSLARRNQLRRDAMKRAAAAGNLQRTAADTKTTVPLQPGATASRLPSQSPRVAAFVRDMSTFVALGDIPRELSGPFRLRSLYDVVCFVRKLLSVAKANPILYDGSGQLQYITMQAMAATTSKLPGVGKVGGSSSSTSGRSRAAADPAKVKLREFLQRYYTGPHKSLAPSS